MKNFALSIGLYIFCFGLIALYTISVYLLGHNFWPEKAGGSLILDEQKNIRGSYLLAQHLKDAKYFRARPSMEFDKDCDVALYNIKFKEALVSNYKAAGYLYDVSMITPSASWYDPYVTKREAMVQAARVSKARKVPLERIHNLIDENTLYSQAPFFELDIVNVTVLNAELDGI